jgi:hypothetical protein
MSGGFCILSGCKAGVCARLPFMALFWPLTAKSLLAVRLLPMLNLDMRKYIGGRSLAAFLLMLLFQGHLALAADLSWNKIRYQAGTVDAKVNPFDWNTTLKVSPSGIEMIFAGSKKIMVENRNVTALTYGEAAYRRINEMLGNASSKPVPLFGIVKNGNDHLVGIEFKNADGTKGAVLLMVHKDSYSDLLHSLSVLTGQTAVGTP